MSLVVGDDNAITFDDVKELRRTTENKKKHKVFVFYQEIVPCLVGRREWDMKRAVSTISEIVTPSLEAMALWIIDNYGEKWSRKGSRTEKAKYTSVTQGNKLFGGWNEHGIERFNNLICLVRKNRSEDINFEKSFLAYCQEEEENREEKRLYIATENNISCMDDLDDDDSSMGEDITEKTTKRYNVQVPSIVNVTENYVEQYDVPSPELSVTSKSSGSVSRAANSIHGTSSSGNGLYGNFGVTGIGDNVRNRAAI